MTTPDTLALLLQQAVQARAALFDERHQTALRLFNGFAEGCPALVADLYGTTIVLHNYAAPPEDGTLLAETAQRVLCALLPWVRAVVLKQRRSAVHAEQQGALVHGTAPDRRVREHGVWYALDLLMNRDASLYLDTRNLRRWAIDNLAGKRVLNTFAYTGSLGVAAMAGGATQVVQLDLNRQFLNVAKTSYTLNGFPIHKPDFVAADFWPQISRMRRTNERFDCVFLDPPFFAATDKGVVDLASNAARLINKVRPLIAHGGALVAINNALYHSGAAYMAALDALCADGYMAVEALIPVPDDCIGVAHAAAAFPTDPAPFNHPTKIALLRVRRKDAT